MLGWPSQSTPAPFSPFPASIQKIINTPLLLVCDLLVLWKSLKPFLTGHFLVPKSQIPVHVSERGYFQFLTTSQSSPLRTVSASCLPLHLRERKLCYQFFVLCTAEVFTLFSVSEGSKYSVTSHSAHTYHHYIMPFLKNIPIIQHFSFPKNLKWGVSSPFIKSIIFFVSQCHRNKFNFFK